MDQTNIPAFMQEFYDSSNDEGREELKCIADYYRDEKSLFLQTTFNLKRSFQRDWNRLTGENHKLTVESALAPLHDKYKAIAWRVSEEHPNAGQALKEEISLDHKQTIMHQEFVATMQTIRQNASQQKQRIHR